MSSRLSPSSPVTWKHLQATGNGWLDEALKFGEMLQRQGIPLSTDLACHMLYDCTKQRELKNGRRILSLIICSGLDSVTVLANYLIRLFASCGSMIEANEAFHKVPRSDQYTWNAIINATAKVDKGELALQLYDIMQNEGGERNRFVLPCIVKACNNIGSIAQGRYIHEQIFESELEYHIVVGTTLVDMYAKCGSLNEAERMFDKMPARNAISWGTMIAGYAQYGEGYIALQYFENMQHVGIQPDQITLTNVLKACNSIGAIEHGRCVHQWIVGSGLQLDLIIGSTLVNMYAKWHCLEEAIRVFKNLPNRDVVIWNAMIAGCVQHGEDHLALQTFKRMQHDGVKPSKVTFLSILKVLGSIEDVKQSRCVHEHIIEDEDTYDPILGSALVDAYAKCGSLEEARRVFINLSSRDVVAWGAMISGYAHLGEGHLALNYFEDMQNQSIIPDNVSFLGVLQACGTTGAIAQGRCLHEEIVRKGLHFDITVGNTLVDMYAKCGSLKEAYNVFSTIPNRDVVSWGAMIAGYVDLGDDKSASECFEYMQQDGIKTSRIVFLSMLKSCGNIGTINQGRCLHHKIVQCGLHYDIVIGSTVVDMYAKCGSLEEARSVFDSLPKYDVVLWGAMLGGYAQFGEAVLAAHCFEDFQSYGIIPNEIALSGILTALSRGGLVDETLWYFNTMKDYCGAELNLYHYICTVDLLGRAGHLHEAENLLKISKQHDICLWMALLSACSMHYDMELGIRCFKMIVHLDPLYAPGYVIMANMYATAHMKDEASRIEMWRKSSCAWKEYKMAQILINDEVE